ncbi:hypothetical protein [Pseudoalteromonas sp.]|uniref:hypothetical protein n=1 Tax=Pseudoalteromonas sp. TaxID=53249 RepID=UPI00356B257E
MTIKLSSKGGGGLPRLAPDLNYLATRVATTSNYSKINLDVSGGVLQTALSITGKFKLDYIELVSLTASESVKSKLTVDGVVIFDGSAGYTVDSTRDSLIGYATTSGPVIFGGYEVKESLLLEYATTTDTSIDLNYLVRPIL